MCGQLLSPQAVCFCPLPAPGRLLLSPVYCLLLPLLAVSRRQSAGLGRPVPPPPLSSLLPWESLDSLSPCVGPAGRWGRVRGCQGLRGHLVTLPDFGGEVAFLGLHSVNDRARAGAHVSWLLQHPQCTLLCLWSGKGVTTWLCGPLEDGLQQSQDISVFCFF